MAILETAGDPFVAILRELTCILLYAYLSGGHFGRYGGYYVIRLPGDNLTSLNGFLEA